MAGQVNEARVAVRHLFLVLAMMGLGYMCIRTLRFTNDLLNLGFVCAFFLIPWFGIRPVLRLRHWTKWVTTILLLPLMVLSLLSLVSMVSCDIPAAIQHRGFSRELASIRQGSYSVHLLWQETAGGALGPHGLSLEQRMPIAPGLYVVRHLDYFEDVSHGSLLSEGPDQVRLRIPRSYEHHEVDKVYSLKRRVYF